MILPVSLPNFLFCVLLSRLSALSASIILITLQEMFFAIWRCDGLSRVIFPSFRRSEKEFQVYKRQSNYESFNGSVLSILDDKSIQIDALQNWSPISIWLRLK